MAAWTARMAGVMNLTRWCEFGPATEFVVPVFSLRLAGHWPRDPLPAACALLTRSGFQEFGGPAGRQAM